VESSMIYFGWSVRVMGFLVMPLLGFSRFAIQARLPPRKTSFFIAHAFKEVRFLMIVAAGFCCFIGMFTPLFFIPSYAVSRGIDATFASYLLAIVNAASTFGRIIPGVLADRFGKLNMFAIGGLFTGVIGLCMNTATSTASLVVYSIAFGFSSDTIISGASAAFSICTDDPRNLGTYMGRGVTGSGVRVLDTHSERLWAVCKYNSQPCHSRWQSVGQVGTNMEQEIDVVGW
ncbi:riboflavin transporter MCH5, partial [Staphylotrichum tortipilum]